ncbi:tyrosine-type recombinase/integrase [Ancylobacter oerskovii]|uniref:Tyrosine-type recombinase/integrase n=1 Tax=Ancylobacter oerskovii TaxID=459519 RepID=A0ABW4Z1H1_9HYPH|nr:site-specific integrase [Ancylobacter oerskovii]MBS7545063.1 site-specific integrase [Ancylobacter oerskovii]
MSVYKQKGRDTYYYDFQLKGRRYSGNTGETAKRKAEAHEDRIRTQIRAELGKGQRPSVGKLTWGDAADRFWLEVGQFHAGGGDRHTKRALDWVSERIGRSTLLVSINGSIVADLVARRRGERVETKKDAPLVKPATVNRSVTEIIRKVLYRARDVWEEPIPNIKWSSHVLDEPNERIRELTPEEEEKLFRQLRPDYQPISLFALASGVRLSGCLKMQWPDIDWGNRRVNIKGKGGRDYSIPLSKEMRDILWPLQGKHAESVFTYIAQRTREGRKRGERHPITENGLMSEWRRALSAAGIKDYRWHDHRHTKATRFLRASGNLKLVQRLLGHSRIETTGRYAHVTDDDLRDALDVDYSQQKSQPGPVEEVKKDDIAGG